MIVFLMVALLNSAQAFPNFLTQQEILHEGHGPIEWDCFFTSQIRQIECREWIDDTGLVKSEKSDMNFVVETDNAIYSYGFNNAHQVCRDIKKDMQNLLKGQKYFCMLADYFDPSDFEVRGKTFKPVLDRVYKCLKTPIGSVSWFGGMGPCLDEEL